MIEGVKRVTGFVDESGPMVRVTFEGGGTIVGEMLPTLAALHRIDYFEPVQKEKTHLTAVGR